MNKEYLGDLNKTSEIFSLFQVPVEKRDGAWRQRFYSNVSDASFCCSDPQVISGPDGFPYFVLLLPEPAKPFQCFVIRHMKDDFLLEQGLGVVIEPKAGTPQWVFSYGDIVGFHLKDNFEPFNKPGNTPAGHSIEVIEEAERVLLNQPSETFLPAATRQVLKRFLEGQGIKSPNILLMSRTRNHAHPTQELVFDLDADKAGNEEKFRAIMGWLSWFLPRGFTYCSVPHSTFANEFEPL